MAGDGHGCGMAVIGPHEGGWNEPDRSTAQTGRLASATDPPPASAPYVESLVESTFTVVADPICTTAVALAASAEIEVGDNA